MIDFHRACTNVCIWRPEVDAECLPQLLSTLHTEARSLTRTPELKDLASLASQLAPGILCLKISHRVWRRGSIPTGYLHGYWDLNFGPHTPSTNVTF